MSTAVLITREAVTILQGTSDVTISQVDKQTTVVAVVANVPSGMVGFSGSLDFSVNTNSMYLPVVM